MEKIPEEKKELYYFLVENVSSRAGGFYLDDKFIELINEIIENGVTL